MNEAGHDDITPRAARAPPTFRTILFLPGASPGIVVAGTQRSEGWVGQCPVAEADDLCRQDLAVSFPDDWPALPPPAADGEPLANYIEHSVFGHPTVIALMRLGASIGLKAAIISPVRPGERNVQWWLREHSPECCFDWTRNTSRYTTLFNYRKYLVWRLMVQLFDQLRGGAWVVFGRLAGDIDYALQPVPSELWHHPDMVLNYRPGGDWLRSDQRPGWPAPAAGLPAYGGLILHGAPMVVPTSDGASGAAITRSGAQGRPTSITNLLLPELLRRQAAEETLSTQAAEAKALSLWLARAHPKQPQVSGKGVENALRDELRASVGAVKERDIK